MGAPHEDVRAARGVLRRALPLVVVVAAGLPGCGDDGTPRDAGGDRPLPTVTQDARVDAPDVAGADRLCRRFQERRPEGVARLRIRIAGSPSVTCIVQ